MLLVAGCSPKGARSALEAEALIQQRQFQPALEKLRAALDVYPAHATLWNHLGLAYHALAETTNAVRAYQRALSLDPNLAVARYNLGCLYLERQQLAAAADELKRFTMLQPQHAEGWLRLGTASLRLRQWDTAEKQFLEAQKLGGPNAEIKNALGLIQAHRRRPRDAVQLLGDAASARPPYAPAVLNLAIVYHHQLTNRALALQRYEQYASLTPPPARVADVQSIVHQLRRELEPASPVAAATNAVPVLAARTNPAPAATTNLVAGARLAPPPAHATSTNTAALGVTAPATNPAPSSASRPATASAPARRTNAPPTAVAAAAVPPTNPPPRQPAAAGVAPAGRDLIPARPQATNTAAAAPRADAAPVPLETVRLTPEPPLAVAQDSTPRANQEPRERRPDSPSAGPGSGSDATLSGATLDPAHTAETELKETGERPREGAETNPGFFQRINPVTWFRPKPKPSAAPTPLPRTPAVMTATAPTNEVRRPTSAEVQRAAAPPRPRYAYRAPSAPAPGQRRRAEPHFIRGVEEQRRKRLGAAIAAYQEAIVLDPAYFEAHYNLGLSAYNAGDLPLALRAYETALALNPGSRDARYNLALALQQASYLDDAVDELQRSVAAEPADTRAHLALANLYAQQLEQPRLARPHYAIVLEQQPDHPQAAAIRSWLGSEGVSPYY
jgi:tetratricopeptide (TPR) repeat protein